MWVKICANTTLDDALMAADLGADAVGFIFAPSRRQVTVTQVAAISTHLPSRVERIGVFAGSTPEDLAEIAEAAERSFLTGVQLHGEAPLSFADALRNRLGAEYSIIQTAHWRLNDDDASEAHVAARLRDLADHTVQDRVLVDAKVGPVSGGLGVAYDWSRARPVLASQAKLKVIVAGGLNLDNVAEAVLQLQPYGVDVASGVEQSPGVKNLNKVEKFIRAARGLA